MRFNSLAFRLFATAAVVDAAGAADRRLHHLSASTATTCRRASTAQLLKLVNAITVDSMGSSGDAQPLPPSNLYEPLFEVTHSGWYWQITPLDRPDAAQARLALARHRLAAVSRRPEASSRTQSGARWMNTKGRRASRCASSR